MERALRKICLSSVRVQYFNDVPEYETTLSAEDHERARYVTEHSSSDDVDPAAIYRCVIPTYHKIREA